MSPMHLLPALLALMGSATAFAAPSVSALPMGCPRAGAPVVERFMAADCPACWAAEAPLPGRTAWVFDWLTPVAAGDGAPLSAAATPEAAERVGRLRVPLPAAGQHQRRQDRLPVQPGWQLKVQSGPAWNGYFGLQLEARGRWPAGSSAWLALVERIPAGSEGTTAERWLVRTVAGPLPLTGSDQRSGVSHLRALRWPAGAEPGRLESRGWIESADGSLLAVADARCAPPSGQSG